MCLLSLQQHNHLAEKATRKLTHHQPGQQPSKLDAKSYPKWAQASTTLLKALSSAFSMFCGKWFFIITTYKSLALKQRMKNWMSIKLGISGLLDLAGNIHPAFLYPLSPPTNGYRGAWPPREEEGPWWRNCGILNDHGEEFNLPTATQHHPLGRSSMIHY